MKILCSVFGLFFFASLASAQVLSDPSAKPDLLVLQKKWHMDVRNAALEEDQFKIQKERDQQERARKDLERQNETRAKQGMPTVPPSARRPETRARGISITYIYEIKIKNTGEKEIRTLTWDYVFYDPVTQQEVGRRQFVSNVRISPGKTRNVVGRSAFAPTDTLDAAKADKKSQEQYTEQVMIQSAGYADGSVWKAASN